MARLVLLVAVVALICGGFYSWSRKQGLTRGDAQSKRPGGGHVALLTEAVAYVGAILVLAGGAAAIGQHWNDISDWARVGVFAVAAALFLTVGFVVRGVHEAAVQRLVGVLWFLSVACVAGAAGFAAHGVYGKSGEVTALLIGITVSVYAAALWLVRRGALQNLALFAGLVVTICGTIAIVARGSAPSLAIALALWGFGLAWALVGWRRYVEPLWVAVPVGVLLALLAPSFTLTDHGWMHAIGLVTAAAVMAASIPLRNTVLLAMGTIAMFGYVTSMVVRYFADSLGAPTALALTGGFILILAAISARLMRATRKPQSEQQFADGSSHHDRPKVS